MYVEQERAPPLLSDGRQKMNELGIVWMGFWDGGAGRRKSETRGLNVPIFPSPVNSPKLLNILWL